MGSMVQVQELLLSKCEKLSLNPVTKREREKDREREKEPPFVRQDLYTSYFINTISKQNK
jgi:hypothetical protein